MENKVFFRKYFFLCLIICLFTIIAFGVFNEYRLSQLRKLTNERIATIVSAVTDKYPDVETSQIVEILSSDDYDSNILSEFGYDIETDSFIEGLDKVNRKMSIIGLSLVVFSIGSLVLVLVFYNRRVDKEVRNLIVLVDRINHQNYELELESYNEDELSILKSEIYKTTIMLKEAAENSLKDKVQLKNTLADISHQLKTPLTSVIIMLDAIIDDEDMDKVVRENFISDIKREMLNINFLVQSLLKLSKFDANAIKFINESIELRAIVDEAVKNVSTLCDLKNVEIEIGENGDVGVYLDLRWQVEALTNILKNCVEHSFENSKIKISFEKNKIYSSIIIEDSGRGIDKKDIPHIFERFYKGRNSSKDSVGIGLALAKSIIEKSDGHITCESQIGKGTTFKIKYFANGKDSE